MACDVPDAYEADLVAFVATLTDDRELLAHLVGQSLARVADEPSTDPAEAARVWAVRGLLSDGYVLGSPVAADVDTAADVASDPAGDDLQARFARSSRLQRAVVALYYGRHSDAAAIARIVGSSESNIEAYLAGVRGRLGIDGTGAGGTDGGQSVRRLLQDRYLVELAQTSATAQAEHDRATAELEQEREQARLASEHRLAETARTDELIAELRGRLDTALAAHDEVPVLEQQRQAAITELARERERAAAHEAASAGELETLQARLDEQAEQARRSAEERRDEMRRTDELIAELTTERDLAAARETATAGRLESLQVRLDEQAEQARLSTEERLAGAARTDALVVELRQGLQTAVAAGEEAEALNEQHQATIAELTTERDLAAERETATAAQLESLQARLDEQAEQARVSAQDRLNETRRTDSLIAEPRQPIATAQDEDEDVEPVAPPEPARFEAARPMVFTAIGPG